MALLLRRSRADTTDETLIECVRDGDDEAFAELYRRHVKAATSTARWLTKSATDADDAVSEAFAGVLQALRHGHGPRENFRAYLLACVRNACYGKKQAPVLVGDDVLETTLPAFEDPERYVEADTIARAFASLSPRWQQALWLTEVEQRPLADVGAELGLAPNATAALRHRAREGFASAYLSEHLARAASPTCTKLAPKLGAYVRETASPTDVIVVEQHLTTCPACQRAVDELRDVNGSLRSLQGPGVATGAAAAASVTTVVAGSSAVGGGFAALAGGGVALKIAVVALLAVPAAVGGDRLIRQQETINQHVVVPASTNADEPATPALGSPSSTVVVVPGGRSGPVAATPTTDASSEAPATTMLAAPTEAAPLAAAPTLPGGESAVLPVDAPALALPGVTVGITTPAISTPAVAVPGISVPPIALPPITTPALSTPALSTPPISTPEISLGPITVPSVTVPSITVPPITVPSLGLPAITVTVPVTVPPTVVLPPLTIPSIGVPPLLGNR